jgi:hypothetical protein
MKNGAKVILGLIVLIVVFAAVYFTWYFEYDCEDIVCFQKHQAKCSRANYVFESDNTVLAYNTKYKDSGQCVTGVKMVAVKEGTADKRRLEGLSMDCWVQMGERITAPEKDLSECHGLLKEEIQEIMIQNAHSQIIANIGEISEELNKVL